MLCFKCGIEFENSKFCPECGTPANEVLPPQKAQQVISDQAQRLTSQYSQQDFSFQKRPKKEKNKNLSIILIIVGILIFLGTVGDIIARVTISDTPSDTNVNTTNANTTIVTENDTYNSLLNENVELKAQISSLKKTTQKAELEKFVLQKTLAKTFDAYRYMMVFVTNEVFGNSLTKSEWDDYISNNKHPVPTFDEVNGLVSN